MSRYAAKDKMNDFWSNLKKVAEKSGKIDSIDARIMPKYTGPATSINTRQRTPSREPVSSVRGGIHAPRETVEVFYVDTRDVRGTENPEHNQAGRSMSAIMYEG